MAKKIVILNGSPRPSGNTAALIEAFTKGAEQAGNGVVRFDVCKMNIHPCLGCCGGGKLSLIHIWGCGRWPCGWRGRRC